MNRRSPRLTAENEPPRIWRVRIAPGDVREPLNELHVRALVETGAASAASEIARVGADDWQRLDAHPLWATLAPQPTNTVRLVAPAAADPGVVRVEVHAPTEKMQALWNEHHETVKADLTSRAVTEDHGRFLQGMAYASAIAGLICVGDVIVFTCSLVTAFVFLIGLVRLTALALVWKAMK